MPGRIFPSSNSREAPPPVLTKVTLSSMSHLAAAVALSPPPIMPFPPDWARSAEGEVIEEEVSNDEKNENMLDATAFPARVEEVNIIVRVIRGYDIRQGKK